MKIQTNVTNGRTRSGGIDQAKISNYKTKKQTNKQNWKKEIKITNKATNKKATPSTWLKCEKEEEEEEKEEVEAEEKVEEEKEREALKRSMVRQNGTIQITSVNLLKYYRPSIDWQLYRFLFPNDFTCCAAVSLSITVRIASFIRHQSHSMQHPAASISIQQYPSEAGTIRQWEPVHYSRVINDRRWLFSSPIGCWLSLWHRGRCHSAKCQ